MNRYLNVLRAEPLLRRLSLIQLIAYFGAWFSNVAIYTLLIHLGTSPLVIAVVAALHFLPGVLQAPFSGPLIDKVAPKKLMVFLLTVEIATTLPLMLIESKQMLWLLYGLVFIRMGASSFYFPLEMALLPRILEAKKLKLANEIHSIIWSFSYTVGMAASGIVVYLVGVKIAFLLDALLFAIAFALLFKAAFPGFERKHSHGYREMLKQSFHYLKANPLIRHLMLLHALVGLTAFDALVALAAERYYMPAVAASLAIGLTHALRAVGLIAGPMFLGKWINHRRLLYLLLFQGVSIMLWAAVLPYFYLSLAVSVMVGFSTTTVWSFTYTLLQRHTDDTYYGRVVAYNDMLFLLTVSSVSMLIGWLVQNGMNLQTVLALPGIGFLGGAAYYRWIGRHYRLERMHR